MGLIIHYTGKIKDISKLEDMVEEVQDIASVYQWKYTLYNKFSVTDKNNNTHILNGISFTPPDCEAVSLCFLKDRKLCCPVNLQYGDINTPQETLFLSVKTQFGGLANHIILITLLKYISGKYLESFTLKDESKLLETENIAIAQQKFEQYNQFIHATSAAFQILVMEPDESIEDYAKRSARYLESNQKNKDPNC